MADFELAAADAPTSASYNTALYVQEEFKAFEDLQHEGVVAGGEGDAVGQFNGPYCIDVDEHDNIFVPDLKNNRVQGVSSAGNVVCSIGSKGQGDGRFYLPTAVAVDRRRSRLLVADYCNHRVQAFAITYNGTEPSLRFVGKFGSQGSEKAMLKLPCDIAVSAHTGLIFVAEQGNRRVQVLTADFKHVAFIGNGILNTPYAIALDENDACYVADYDAHQVAVFGGDGALLRRFGCNGEEDGEFINPQSICMDDKRGLVIVGDGNGIQGFRKDDCSFVGKLRDKPFDTTGVCVDSQGRIVASNYNDNTVVRWS